MRAGGPDIAATITAHHLVINRNHILAGGIRPHYYCLPVAKREEHRLALRAAATCGDPRYFLGTDSAPHVGQAQGTRLRLRGLLHGHEHAARSSPRSSSRKARSTGSKASCRSTAPPSTACRVNEDRITLRKGEPVPYPAKIETGDGPVTVFDPGLPPALAGRGVRRALRSRLRPSPRRGIVPR